MKLFLGSLLSFLSILWIGCAEQKGKSVLDDSDDASNMPLKVPDTLVERSALHYNHDLSLWTTLNGAPYSGFAVSYYSDHILKEKFGILDGKKQNKFIKWYPDGHFKNVANYHKGKLHGEKKIWTDDSAHVLIVQYNYHEGRPHGEQTKWYSTGELFKKMNLNRGKEEGLQQAFRKNGDLYANYEARKGRIFGLKKSTLCYSLEDENIQNE